MTLERIYEGFDFIRHRKATKARKLFKEILDKVESAADNQDIISLAYAGKGYALMCMYKYHAASLAFESAIEHRSDNMLAHAYRYKALRYGKDREGASKAKEAIEEYRGDFSVEGIFNAWDQFGIAEILYDEGKFDKALKAFELCRKSDENLSIIALNGEARCHVQKHLKEKAPIETAIEKCNEVLAQDPKFAAAHFNKGLLYRKNGDLDKAAESFDSAIAVDSDYAEAYNSKGVVLAIRASEFKNSDPKCAKSLLEQAMIMFDESIRANSEFPMPYMHKGQTLYNFEMYDQAIIVYNHALRIDPYYVKTYNAKGNALCALLKYDEALKSHEEALKFHPTNYIALNDKAWCLLKLGRYQEALKAADAAIKSDDSLADAHHTKGAALKALGKLEKAFACYSKSVDLLKPDQDCFRPILYIDMGAALFDMEEYTEALKYFEMANAVFYNSKDLDLDSRKRLENILGPDGEKGKILSEALRELVLMLDQAGKLNTIEIQALEKPIRDILDAVDIRHITSESRVKELKEKLSELQGQIIGLKAADAQLEHKLVAIEGDVLILKEDIAKLEPIFDDVEVFAKAVPMLREGQEIDADLALIIQDSYKNAFYNELRSNLNAVYLAAKVVSSGIVDHDKKGAVSKAGAIIKYAGEHVPMVGIGFKILGSLLKSVDYEMQREKLTAFASIASSNSEMEQITNTIARILALDPDFKVVEKEKTILSRIKDWVLDIGSAVSENDSLDFEALSSGKWAGSAANLAIDFTGEGFVVEGAISLIKGSKISEGKKAASIVAKVVTKLLFDGKLLKIPKEDRITKIIELVKIECDAILDLQDDFQFKQFATNVLKAIADKETKEHESYWKEKEGLERSFIHKFVIWLEEHNVKAENLEATQINLVLDNYNPDLVVHKERLFRSTKSSLTDNFLDSNEAFESLTGLGKDLFSDADQ